MAHTMEGAGAALAAQPQAKAVVAGRLDRRVIDLLISWAGAVVAMVLIGVGGAAIYGGAFAMDNVRDRLAPQNITFKATEEMTPAEAAVAGEYGGQTVTNGVQAEAFADYIGVHLADTERFPHGMSYSELGGVQAELNAKIAAAEASNDPALAGLQEELAALNAERETIFKGEMLRGTLLNAYGWWTVGQITQWVGFGAIFAGLILAVFAALGFRHARKVRRA